MGSKYNELRQLIVNSIVDVCQQQSFYIEELKVEGTLCITSDGASVLVTQITEKIGEKSNEDAEKLPAPDAPVKEDGEQEEQLDSATASVGESHGNHGDVDAEESQPADAAEKLEQLKKGGSVHSFWKMQQKSNGGYKCPFCKNVYRFKHSLKDHLNKHIGRKPYSCKHCGMSFTHLASLCAHTRRVHPKQMSWDYKCPLCQQCFLNQQSLKQHCTWRHHDVNWTHLMPWFVNQGSTSAGDGQNPDESAQSPGGDKENQNVETEGDAAPASVTVKSETPVTQSQETSETKDKAVEKEPPVSDGGGTIVMKQEPQPIPGTSCEAPAESPAKEVEMDTDPPAVAEAADAAKDNDEYTDDDDESTDGDDNGTSRNTGANVAVGNEAAMMAAGQQNMLAQAMISQAMAMQMSAGLWPSMGAWFSQGQMPQPQPQPPPTPQQQLPQSYPTPTPPRHSSPVASPDNIAAVLNDVRKDVRTGKFPCPYCHKSYRYKHTLKDHLNNHTGMRPHVCDICGSSFIHLASLCAHVKRLHSNENVGDFKCPACRQTFRKLASLKQHITWQHKELQSSTTDWDSMMELSQGALPSFDDMMKAPGVPPHPLSVSSAGLTSDLSTSVASTKGLVSADSALLTVSSDSVTYPTANLPSSCTSSFNPVTSTMMKPMSNGPDLSSMVEGSQAYPQFYQDWAKQLQTSAASSTEAATATVTMSESVEDGEVDTGNSTVISQYFTEVQMDSGIPNQPNRFYKCKLCEKMYRHRTSVYDHINTHLNKKPYVCRECGDAFAHHSSLFNHTKSKHS